MILWGVNALNHDASISVVDSESREILFAAHAERYSRVKNDIHLNESIINDALLHGFPKKIVWFENPWGRRARYLKSGQWNRLTETFPKAYMKRFGMYAPIVYSDHHASHAAGGYFTSGFSDAAILVIDAIGELTTASIWEGKGHKLRKRWQLKYPHSVGLFYSAITHLVGLKPNEEEYILMGMAAYGDRDIAADISTYISSTYFHGNNIINQSFNFHQGVAHDETLKQIASTEQGKFSLALSAQLIVTNLIKRLLEETYYQCSSNNLVYSGGVALNCVANSEIAGAFDNIWIMPNPGDAGNSLGAIANYLRKPLKWKGPFLGHNIPRDEIDMDGLINELLTVGVAGVARGRAEFGPRALGNRSLLADPRRSDAKDRVNKIKQRQEFRPFAPAVLAEHAHECFRFPGNVTKAPYMQFVVDVLEPEKYPAIAHIDNTARVQTVDEEAAILRVVLERWYQATGCPMLLNTSLNIKGEPLVNSVEDARRWEAKYGVKVF